MWGNAYDLMLTKNAERKINTSWKKIQKKKTPFLKMIGFL